MNLLRTTVCLGLLTCFVTGAPANPPGSIIQQIAKSFAASNMVSVDMQDSDVKSVVKGLAKQHNINLVFATDLISKRTLSLKNVTFDEALSQLIKYDGMMWHKDKSVYVVGTKEKLAEIFPELRPAVVPKGPEPEIIQTAYTCNHIKAGEAVIALGKLYPPESGLLVLAAPSSITPGLSSTYSAKQGISASPIAESSSEPQTARTLLLRGPAELVQTALDALKKMDLPRRQVNVSVTISDVSEDALKDLGLEWSWSGIGLKERSTGGIGFGKYLRDPFNVSSVLSALETQGKSKLLASPSVSVLDGEKAFVLIGQRILYPVIVGLTPNNTPIFDKQEERVGIYLQVSAVIADNGDVTLTLYPQVSSITGYLQQNGASYPQISTREAQTTLRVKNGQPIVIGGLMREEEVKQMQKVPGLGDIPFFGELFKHRKTTKSTSQIVIVIVPTVLVEKAL